MNNNKPSQLMMLKDYLELDSSSESSGAGFRCAPRWANTTVHQLSRTTKPKNNPFNIIFKFFSSSSKDSSLQRSFSNKFRGSFWKKREDSDNEVRVRVLDIMFEEPVAGLSMRSMRFSTPVVSRCSSCSEFDASLDFVASSVDCSDSLNEVVVVGNNDSTNMRRISDQDESSVDCCGSGNEPAEEMENKSSYRCSEEEQLSPVAVMDFPSEEEEEKLVDSAASSPSFHQCLDKIERTKLELLQKIKRFESLANLDAVDLEQQFASCEENESESVSEFCDSKLCNIEYRTQARDLLCQVLQQTNSSSFVRGPAQESIHKLLLDFFGQGLSSISSDKLSLSRRFSWYINELHCESLVEHKLLNMALMYVSGGSTTVSEEEEMNGRWVCFDDEEEEIGIEVEGVIMDCLVEEMVMDLVV